MRYYRLFAFTDGRIVVITRGINEDQAMSYAACSDGAFPRGVTIYPTICPINSAELYSKNHADGWLYRAPVWVQKQERDEAVKMGVEELLQQIRLKLSDTSNSHVERVQLYNESHPLSC